jgi:cysteine desulfurase/selenocysteine lyase
MINRFKKDFPIFQLHNKPLIYLDNAATSHKPQSVLDAMVQFYTHHNANVQRGLYDLGEQATHHYEQAREVVAQFIHAEPHEIVFTQGTTHGINLVAKSWARHMLKAGDVIVLTELEHHSNLLPWQQIAQETGVELQFIPITSEGALDLTHLDTIITNRTKLVACTHVSHVLGSHTDVATIVRAARSVGAKIVLDAAQSAPHQTINVKNLDVDFVAFSGHKLLGPTGIGVLYVNSTLHNQIQPQHVGGGMALNVDTHQSTFRDMPHALEAGTPPIAQAIGLAAAINYLTQKVDFSVLQQHEAQLCAQFIDGLNHISGITVFGLLKELKQRGHVVSFVVDNMHPHDVATYLNHYGICVRAGNHCAQPLMKKLGISGSVRVSFYLYNTTEDVAKILFALDTICRNSRV